ncbi:MAG: guanylate kinase [Candidatus Omnitrophota bacterium]|nr:guanylate kinase [Candidatus Omnitrophota bacterium]MBU1894431.1 guanylate kinase [Candidatus Omnitrophota bacterium]
MVVIISAPSGSGKTTIVNEVLKSIKGITRSVSWTTRDPRKGEKPGKDYIFVSKKEFEEKVKNGNFLEYEENFGNYYGTPKMQFKEAESNGIDIILSIDVKGARKVKAVLPESVSIFILPPSEQVLEERLKKRNTDEEKDVLIRLRESKIEMKSANEYDYLIINDNLEEAVEKVSLIIETERKRRVH